MAFFARSIDLTWGIYALVEKEMFRFSVHHYGSAPLSFFGMCTRFKSAFWTSYSSGLTLLSPGRFLMITPREIMIATVNKRNPARTKIDQQGTSQLAGAFSSAKKEQLIFFLFSHVLLHKLHTLFNTVDHRNPKYSAYWMTDILLWLNVLCE